MGLIIVNAKVKLMSESDLDGLEEHERLGTQPASAKWVWRNIAIHTNDIRRVVAYNTTKTLIQDYYDVYTLVKEPFIDVYKKWDENKEDYPEIEEDVTEDTDFEEDESS